MPIELNHEEVFSRIAALDFRADSGLAVQQAIDEKLTWFEGALASGGDAFEINNIHSKITDHIINSLVDSMGVYNKNKDRIAILALGGYGRREYGLHCDIDLLFLHDGSDDSVISDIAEGVLYPFWNSSAEIGGATRTIEQCRDVIEDDVKALTAMIDARFVAGNEMLYHDLMNLIAGHFATKRSKQKYFRDKIAERDDRLKRYGDTIYLLQPNIKEGEGGLRDFHTLDWISNAISFSEKKVDAFRRSIPRERARYELIESLRYIWKIRDCLHVIEKKRGDRLSENLQGEVAIRMGISSGNGVNHTEELMSSYYEHALRVHLLCDRALERIRRVLFPGNTVRRLFMRRKLEDGIYLTEHKTLSIEGASALEDHKKILKAFAFAKRRSIKMDPETKDNIAHLSSIPETVRSSDAVNHIWQDIFSNYTSIGTTLRDMHECNYLTKWFHEMKPIINLVQHDGFHIYTAGEHSIRTVHEIAKIHSGKKDIDPHLKDALSKVGRPHILMLAALLHDVGKGRGGGHSSKGAVLAYDIVKGLGYSEEDATDVAFLVKYHLTMAKIAFKRDISDINLLNRFAQSFKSPEILSILYILTYADIKAIGPNVWNEWKGSLLSDLYRNTLDSMREGGITTEGRRSETAHKKREALKILGKTTSDKDLDDHLNSLPERYLFHTTPETISAHMMMSREIDSEPLSTISKSVPEKGCSEFSMVTKDKPGLFAEITGVLAAAGANIIDAQLYTSKNGIAMDVFHITDSMDRPFENPEKWKQIRKEMTDVVLGERDIGTLFEDRFKPTIMSKSARVNSVEVAVDNDVSETETVIEIHANDRQGLLYIVASTLRDLHLTIDRARITTHVDRVIDVFYIRDEAGEKVTSTEHLEEIKSSLIERLED
ncbi:MAG: [protein-PII] uridylyltransferase [Deltaproteobacteria bacterium]|jgi:[protein-PII] uridylyltransferase|nr:[protein-PII] uridylyltransferase [Deltaproteobacteria bacterium]